MTNVAVRSDQLTVEQVTDAVRLPALAAVWDALIDDRCPGAVFRSTAWLLPWWEQFSADKELRVYVAKLGTEVVGVLPAYRTRTRFGGQRVQLMGGGMELSDYLGFIGRQDHLEMASTAVARAMLSEERDVVLEDLDANDPLAAALEREAHAAGVGFSRRVSAVCPILQIPKGVTFDEWMRDRPNGAGTQLKRHRRRLEKQSDFRVDILTGEAEISAALPSLWFLHHARWRSEGDSDTLASPALERFLDASARQLARRGWARVYTLRVAGVPRAALYGFGSGHHFAYYQMGRDPAWSRWSIGTVVLAAALEDAFTRGLAEFDFLRGDEAYKHLFASSRRELVNVRLATGVRARAFWTIDQVWVACRRRSRDALPPAAVSWLRRQLRRLRGRGHRLVRRGSTP